MTKEPNSQNNVYKTLLKRNLRNSRLVIVRRHVKAELKNRLSQIFRKDSMKPRKNLMKSSMNKLTSGEKTKKKLKRKTREEHD